MRPACESEEAQARGSRYSIKKPARELRQGGSYYRCCIPALAGFASPHSIAPDGERISSQGRQRATPKRHHECRASDFATGLECLTTHRASVCIGGVKWLALLLLFGLFAAATSCTTLVNRRDLYSPEPAPDSLEAARQWYGVTTTTTFTRMPTGEIAAPPGFGY